ncbi:MAG TPA: hypothetical protein VL117_08155, partial [Thermoleophilia bacterium]|nr:hypothetical protein [Thermoleophilia bacterium]
MAARSLLRLSVRTKLMGLAVTLIVMSALLVLVSVVGYQSVSDQAASMSGVSVAQLNASSDLAMNIVDARRLLDKGVARAGDKTTLS